MDAERIEAGLRAMGLYQGEGLGAEIAGAPSEGAAVRAYLERRLPHLLACYQVDDLVAMVLAAGMRGAPAEIEPFHPH